MFPIEKCMQAMRALVADASPNAIVLAERAIDEFIAAHEGPDRQTGALHVLEQELTPIWRASTGPQLNFCNVVMEYAEARMRSLQVPSEASR